MIVFVNELLTLISIAYLPHYTSGQTYFYPAFNAANSEDAIKFAHEYGEVIAMPIMLEAVIRVRATKGMSAVILACSAPDMLTRLADVYFQWQLFRPFDGLAVYACCAARSVILY